MCLTSIVSLQICKCTSRSCKIESLNDATASGDFYRHLNECFDRHKLDWSRMSLRIVSKLLKNLLEKLSRLKHRRQFGEMFPILGRVTNGTSACRLPEQRLFARFNWRNPFIINLKVDRCASNTRSDYLRRSQVLRFSLTSISSPNQSTVNFQT